MRELVQAGLAEKIGETARSYKITPKGKGLVEFFGYGATDE
ncbi:MAG: DUF4364 family protein [Fimbriimonadaceae bacterium]|nr:DUF4364 family protein [Fimbriimonadaceae bacterium]